MLHIHFPRPAAANKIRMKRKSETHQSERNDKASREGFGTKWKDMPEALKILLTNPVYMFLNMAGVFEGLVVSGVATFMPKLIQNQFSVSAGYAAILGGQYNYVVIFND
jgi:hypothetical protein